MMTEFEPKKFRRGESTGRPLGGNISLEPFPQALYTLALSRGYESQSAFARALGIRYCTVGTWYRGETIPDSDYMGEILVLLQLNDAESDNLLNPYGQQLEEKRFKNSLMRLKAGQAPFDKWVEEYCRDHSLALNDLAIFLGFHRLDTIRDDKIINLDTFSQVLQNAPKTLNLSPDETDTLSEAVATTIEQQIATGKKYRGRNHVLARQLQAQFPCRTYTPKEAAKILGITRGGIHYLRKRDGLPLLLTDAQIEQLKNRK